MPAPLMIILIASFLPRYRAQAASWRKPTPSAGFSANPGYPAAENLPGEHQLPDWTGTIECTSSVFVAHLHGFDERRIMFRTFPTATLTRLQTICFAGNGRSTGGVEARRHVAPEVRPGPSAAPRRPRGPAS